MFVRRKRSSKKGPTEKQSYVPRYQANISPQWPLLTQEKEFRFALAQLEQFGYCKKTIISNFNIPLNQFIYVGQEHVLTPPSNAQIAEAQSLSAGIIPMNLDINYVDYFCGCFGLCTVAVYINGTVVRDENLTAGTYIDHSQSYTYNSALTVYYCFNNGNDAMCIYVNASNQIRMVHGVCDIFIFGNQMNEKVHAVRVPKDYVAI